ncbi:unannotated protein [freshwater metagenome]|uniref:Unannotated protein n=1 Tax=freshwater metagenome TaxID=449393 RepID=A0A6J6AYC2_9ZZZZ
MYSGSAFSASTNTSQPSSAKVSATEKPVTPKPITATFSCFQSECQLVKLSRLAMALSVGPFDVEQADTEQDA